MAALEFHLIAEAGLRIMNPLQDAHLLQLGHICRLTPEMRALDLACGKGELLCRWAQTFGSSGVGVDYFDLLLEQGRARARELGVAERVAFVQGDAAQYAPAPGAFDVVSCIGAAWIGGGFGGTLELMKTGLKPDGFVLMGSPYWHEGTPSEAYGAWNIAPEDYGTLVETLDRIEAAGMELIEMVLSSREDWDRFEAAQWMAVSDHRRAHPDDETAYEAWLWKSRQRRAYLQYARHWFGFGVFVLRRAP
jgi:SAM-dependent methyltransferase